MTEQKTNIRKTFNYLIRAVIILITYGFIYRQVIVQRKLEDIPRIFESITEQNQSLVLMIVVMFLMLINWGVESVKWQLLIAKIERVSFLRAFKAVMTGVSVSLFTPNRTGDYLGRVFILEKGNHVEGILITIIGSFAQIIITFSLGLFCFLSFTDQYLLVPYNLPGYLFTSMIFIVPCLVFVMLVIYFNIGLLADFINRYFPRRWERFFKYTRVFEKYNSKELLVVLLLSFLRYMIFSAQFFLLLRIFGVNVTVAQGMILIPVIYLVMAVVPSVALTDLGIRGSVSIFIIGLYFNKFGLGNAGTELAILTSSTILWFVNLIIPAILGTFFVYSLKFFRK